MYILFYFLTFLKSTHNGDFISYASAGGVLTEEQVGVYCELVLHSPNPVKSDSAKIAGMMDLLHVQGRWGAAARLAFQRSMVNRVTDCSSTASLDKGAASLAPSPACWGIWEEAFEKVWIENMVDVIRPQELTSEAPGRFR